MEKNKIIYLGLIIYFFICSANSFSTENIFGKYVEIKILDKVNSKNSTLNIEVGKEKKFKNLSIKALMCSNSAFDDNPEITAYLQVKDVTFSDKDKVLYLMTGLFASSPSLKKSLLIIQFMWLTNVLIKLFFHYQANLH